MSTEYQLPQLPLGSPEVTLVRWLKQPGDLLTSGEPLLVAVNDRVEVILPASKEGVLEALLAADGASVMVGASIARIATAPLAVDTRRSQADAESATSDQGTIANPLAAHSRVTPVARRIAAISKIDLADIDGSGPGGRILKKDVLVAIENQAASGGPGSLSVATSYGQPTM